MQLRWMHWWAVTGDGDDYGTTAVVVDVYDAVTAAVGAVVP